MQRNQWTLALFFICVAAGVTAGVLSASAQESSPSDKTSQPKTAAVDSGKHNATQPKVLSVPDPFLAWKKNMLMVWDGVRLRKLATVTDRSLVQSLVAAGGEVILVEGSTVTRIDLASGVSKSLPMAGGGASGSCPPLLVGRHLYFLADSRVRKQDLVTGEAEDVASDIFKAPFKYCAELAVDQANGNVVVTLYSEDPGDVNLECDVGAGDECWDIQAAAAEANKETTISIPVTESATATGTTAVTAPTCSWSDQRPKDRATGDVTDKSGKWLLTVSASSRKKPITSVIPKGIGRSVTEFKKCAKTEDAPDDHWCEEAFKPQPAGCEWMREHPFLFCRLRWGTATGEEYSEGAFFLVDETSGKVRFGRGLDSSGDRPPFSPSGCWFFDGSAPVGPAVAPKDLNSLEFIFWLDPM